MRRIWAAETACTIEETTGETANKKKRRTKEELYDEKREFFSQFVDFRAAKVRNHSTFDFQFTTDGVTARLLMFDKRKKSKSKLPLSMLPKRGIWAIDALKHTTRLEEIHVVGIDPGKRELIVAADSDAPKKTSVRYTQAQRRREQCFSQYKKEEMESKSQAVIDAEATWRG